MTGGNRMRSVNVAELKNSLSRYLTYAKQGEEIVVRDRNLPVAKLVPLSVVETSKEELILVAAGKLRLPQAPLDIHKLLKIRTGRVPASQAIQALLDERAEGR
jgi:prevent-host-death family protein